MRKTYIAIPILLLLGFLAAWGYFYQMAGDLLYWGGASMAEWQVQRFPRCNSWRQNTAFADLRGNAPKGKPLELSCKEARNLPAEDLYAISELGMKIHYRLYDTLKTEKDPPIMLYVHGISGNYVDGARYYHAAARTGFQLASMEMSNHGVSDNNGKGAAYGCREHADVTAVFRDLIARYPERNILINATSMGTMATAIASQDLLTADREHQLKAVIFENPIDSLYKVVMANKDRPPLPEFIFQIAFKVVGQRAGYDFTKCTPIHYLKNLKVPTLIQMVQKDHLVPMDMAQRVYNALPQGIPHRFKVYPKGKHSAIWNGQPQVVEADWKSIWEIGVKYRPMTRQAAR